MKIILFRHGQKQKSDSTILEVRRSVCLTSKGITQIKSLSDNLRRDFSQLINSSKIYSSPYPRAIQSAEIVRSFLNISEIIAVPALSEYYAYNNYLPGTQREALMEKAMINPAWIPDDGSKSLDTALDEFVNFFDELAVQGDEDLVLISTHGALIRNLVYRISPEYRPSDSEILNAKIKEGGYTFLDYTDKKFQTIKFDSA